MQLVVPFLLSFLLISTLVEGQDFRGLDQSSLDIAYFPDNFAHDRKPGEEAIIRVTYSRPQVKGRAMFGEKVPYGEVWRTGANEATEVKFYQAVTIDGKALPAGTYSLFTIPNKDAWIVIFSSDLDYWGAYSYQQENDVLRATAPARTLDETVEAFTIQFAENNEGEAVMQFAWEQTLAELPISVAN